MEAKFKVGDKVNIVHSDGHVLYVKEYYGKTLEIEGLTPTKYYDGGYLYKVKGVRNYATEADLVLSDKNLN